MKKCLSAILTIALIFMFAACTNPNGQQNETTTSNSISEDNSNKQTDADVTVKDTTTQKANANNDAKQNPPAQNKPSSYGQQSNSSNSKEKDRQFKAGNSAFIDINQAVQATSQIADTIYQAWFFAIYESKDYTDYSSILTRYCRRTSLDSNDVTSTVDALLSVMGYEPGNDLHRCALLRTNSGAVDVVISIYTAKGWFESIGDSLESAQKNISSLSKDYDEYTDRETLRLYYSEAWEYYNFVLSPTGSFSTLENTVNTYESNLRKYNNQLSFTYLY